MLTHTVVTTSITDRKNISEVFPAVLDRIITGNYSNQIELIFVGAHYQKHLAIQWSDETQTENVSNKIPQWTTGWKFPNN